MAEILDWARLAELFKLLELAKFFPVLRAFMLLVVGYILARVVSASAAKLLAKRLTTHVLVIIKKVLFYGLLILFLISALRQLGFDLSVLLGAAGILTVAIGFASQTSASNLISGVFLMIERPFSIGDIIRVGTTQGEVISIDPLSVKLRTMDNLFVRIPNETMIKSEVTTLTRFPIRRIDLQVGVAYKEDLNLVKKVLDKVAADNPACLDEPSPLFILQGFGASSVDIQFSIWVRRERFVEIRTDMYKKIKQAFDEQGIEIPFPHVSLYAGEATKPFLVKSEAAS